MTIDQRKGVAPSPAELARQRRDFAAGWKAFTGQVVDVIDFIYICERSIDKNSDLAVIHDALQP